MGPAALHRRGMKIESRWRVTVAQLPFVPGAQSDELLSSWLERIGLLYGTSIEHVLSAVLAGSDRMAAMRILILGCVCAFVLLARGRLGDKHACCN